jgi:aspartate racemase
VQCSSNEHVLLLIAHQIACDRPSIEILIRELTAFYAAVVKNEPLNLTELPVSYADFVTWQQEQSQSEIQADRLAYWKEKLGDNLPVIELPIARRRPAIQTFRGARQAIVISQQLLEAIKSLSVQQGCTTFVTLLAAFQTLLYRYTTQEDIAIGSPISGRDRPEIESLIGSFVNTLVFRSDLSGNPSFRELLSRVREVALEAYNHQELPFEQLLEELQLERNLSHSPLFQVMFTLEDDSSSVWGVSGLTCKSLEIDSSTAKFDLSLELKESAGELRGWFEYNSDLFDRENIARLVGHFQTLLESIVTDPDRPIGKYPLLTDAEYQQIVLDWNDTDADYNYDRTIHQMFEERVAQSSDRIAVVFEDRQLTYGELNAKANQLARYLQSLGVEKEVLVGICADRSLEMVVGLLAILKAGGAFLALDPTYPQDRIAYMLEDARVSILLTQSQLLETLPQNQARLVVLDRDRDLIARQSSENIECATTSENLSYAIYTSGSTGKPKGVMITHNNLCHYVQAMAMRLGVKGDDRYLHTASFAFSSSVRQLMVPLSQGATSIVTNTEQRRNPLATFELIKQKRVTVIDIIPSYWRNCVNILAQLQPETKKTLLDNQLRLIVSASEPLPSDLPRRWLQEFKHDTLLINMFGQTETTGIVTTTPMAIDDDDRVKIMPIGRPLPNAQTYILDSELNPLPVGIPGILYLGGANLARGYLNRPELSAEKFIVNPFRNREGARIYDSGDLACYRSDGSIDFIGRQDNQVKIRGFRIELGEIEGAIADHSNIKETVVVAREDRSGDKRLIAYIVPLEESASIATSELRRLLKQKLPEYMIPFAFVVLDALPRTPNGKVNRLALPAPNFNRNELEQSFVAPRNELEQQIANIWEKNLNLSPIGIRDNFFDLGGNSLLAVSLFAEIEQNFQAKLPLSTLFQAPTIEELANIINGKQTIVSWSSLVPIQPEGSKTPLFLIHARGTSILLYRNLAKYLAPEQPVYGLQPKGLDGEQEPLDRVEEMAAHYLQEIRSVQPQGPYLLGGYSFGGDLALEMTQQLRQQGQEVVRLIFFDSRGPNCFQRLPLQQRISIHFENLLAKKHNYLIEKINDWKRWLKDEYRFSLQVKAVGVFQLFGIPLPLVLRNALIENLNVQAARNYQPQFYPGKLVLLRAQEWLGGVGCEIDERLGWGDLAGEGVEIYDVPGNHFTIFEEPHVQKLAEALDIAISTNHNADREIF